MIPRLMLALAATGLGCAAPVAVTVPQPALAAQAGTAWADSVLRTLTLREKAAQMVWPQVLGDYVPVGSAQWQRLVREIQTEKVGGYIMSIGSPTEVATKANALQRLSDVPLIMAADLETGAGFRFRGGYFIPNAIDLGGATNFPPQMALGATGDTTLAYEMGRITAIEGRAVGIHIAFAPVLDVNNNPANPVINTRSFGEDPQLVARLGSAVVRGLQDHGMLATAKHFPGHGDTDVNSHLAMSVVTATRARLDTLELVPFRAAIAEDVGAVMSFHGALPAIDSAHLPATLSRTISTGLLREELDFEGLMVSDALDMRGVLASYGLTEATKRAVSAGMDVLLMPVNVTQTIDAVVAGVREGRFSEARVDTSVRRILEAKARFGLHQNRYVATEAIRSIVGDSAHAATAARIAERSITLVKDEGGQIPLRQAAGTRVLSLTIASRPDLSAGVTFDATLRSAFPSVRSVFIPANDMASGLERGRLLADSADIVIVSSYISQRWDAVSLQAPAAFADFLAALEARGKAPIVVSFGNPYLLQQIAPPAYLIAWGGLSASQVAAGQALLGETPITGQLPITIPPAFPIGHGLRR